MILLRELIKQTQGSLGNPRNLGFLSIFFDFSGFFSQIFRFLVEKHVFWASPVKAIQNHFEISSEINFWNWNMRNRTKTLTLDMSGRAKTCPGGQVLTANQRKHFYLFRFYTFPFLLANLNILKKSCVFIKHNLSFLQNNVIFEPLRQKWCRIIMSFRQNTIFGPETCQIGPKVWNRTCPDLPRPVLLSKFIIFFKIIGFTK